MEEQRSVRKDAARGEQSVLSQRLPNFMLNRTWNLFRAMLYKQDIRRCYTGKDVVYIRQFSSDRHFSSIFVYCTQKAFSCCTYNGELIIRAATHHVVHFHSLKVFALFQTLTYSFIYHVLQWSMCFK